MRTPKRKTQLIHLIEKTWSETDKGRRFGTREQLEVISAIDNTLFYLELLDSVKGENHKTYFIKRFLSTHNNMTQAEISVRYNVCRDSLSDYFSMYLKIFDESYVIIKQLISVIEVDKEALEKIVFTTNQRAVQNRKE